MPTYQYRCTQCGAELEVVQKFSDPALTECARCSGALRKVFNAVGVVFKGSGFYRTDSRNGNGNGNGSTVKAESAEAKGSEPKPGASGPGSDRTSTQAAKPDARAGRERGKGKVPAGTSSTPA